MTKPWLFNLSLKLGRMFQGLIVRDGKIGRVKGLATLAPPLVAWTSGRDLRPLEARSFREIWKDELAEKKN